MNKIKIISDGTSNGTKVVDLETGEFIPHITALAISVEVGGLVTAYIRLVNVKLDMIANLSEKEIPQLMEGGQ